MIKVAGFARIASLGILLLATTGSLLGVDFRERFFDEEDGKLDVSEYLADPGRFLPVPLIVTEPAVGFGGGFAAVFLQPRRDEGEAGWKRPNITAAGGLATENGTKGGGLVDMRYWQDGTLKSKAAAILASANLDFYGVRPDSGEQVARRFNLEATAGQVALEKDLPIDYLSLQVSYTYADIAASLKPGETALVNLPLSQDVLISGAGSSLIYDSRDNLFSPQSGLYSKTSFFVSDDFLGADVDFQKLSQTFILYGQLSETWAAGLKLDGQMVFGDYPFFAKPFIALRGVPVMRYQGESVAFAELELQHKLSERVRLVGFAGGGKTWDSFGPIDLDQSVVSGGLGIRYRIARKFGLDVGVDVATSGDDSAIYLQVGSAWLRM